jgi:hypothetical protein
LTEREVRQSSSVPGTADEIQVFVNFLDSNVFERGDRFAGLRSVVKSRSAHLFDRFEALVCRSILPLFACCE